MKDNIAKTTNFVAMYEKETQDIVKIIAPLRLLEPSV